jgi:hypothetical protein
LKQVTSCGALFHGTWWFRLAFFQTRYLKRSGMLEPKDDAEPDQPDAGRLEVDAARLPSGALQDDVAVIVAG